MSIKCFSEIFGNIVKKLLHWSTNEKKKKMTGNNEDVFQIYSQNCANKGLVLFMSYSKNFHHFIYN